MIRTLRAVEFSRPMTVGSKNPALFLCEGGSEPEDVVVKFREILLRQQFSCVGEVVAALFAGDQGLQHAEPVIVELDAELGEVVRRSAWPEYGDRIERSSGFNFGSVFVGPATEARLPNANDALPLRAFWADLLCFDFVIQNYDRVAENPNYLRLGERVIVIDHEQAFRHLDDEREGEFSADLLSVDPFFQHVAFRTLDFGTDFAPFFHRFSQLPEHKIESYFSQLPDAWCDQRSHRLQQYLHWARDHTMELRERLSTILAR